MSAQRLRDAAKVLRKQAEAATPGPWEASVGSNPTYVAQVGHLTEDDPTYIASCGPASIGGHDTSLYIATMHPGVGLALADWLEAAALDGDVMDDDHAPLRIADLILGGAA